MSAYNPGDVEVVTLSITSLGGGDTIDFAKSFISFDVYESIFAPGIIAYINILDDKNIVGTAKISGGEEVDFAFATPGGQAAQYKLVVNSLKDAESPDGQKSKSYRIECVSQEAFNARSNYVNKKYDLKHFSEMVSDIFESDDFIGSQKDLEIEETKGMFRHVVTNQKPFQAIDTIRRRSVSPENESSSYVFFENRDGFHFKTIEKIFKDGSPLKEYNQDSTIGSDFVGAKNNNILGLEVPHQGSMSQTIASGNMGQSYRTYNFQTLDYKKNYIKDPAKDLKTSGAGPDSRVHQSLKDKYGGKEDKPNRITLVPTNNEAQLGQGSNPNIAKTSPKQMAYAEALASSMTKISVYGDTDLKAGILITANILQKTDATTSPTTDDGLAGTFLVSALRHMVKPPGSRPRYTCEMELVKGGLEKASNQ
jgi:hypothetical protein